MYKLSPLKSFVHYVCNAKICELCRYLSYQYVNIAKNERAKCVIKARYNIYIYLVSNCNLIVKMLPKNLCIMYTSYQFVNGAKNERAKCVIKAR